MFKSLLDNPYLKGKQLPISLFLYFCGMFSIGFGAVLTINSQAGAGGYDALTFALSERLGVPVSYAIYLIAAVSVLATAVIRRSFPRLTTFITALILGVIVDFWKLVLVDVKGYSLLTSLLFLLSGICFIGFGVGAYLLSKFPANPIDDFVLALTERGISLKTAKLGFDIPCFVLAILLGGQLGWGSIVITLGLGPAIHLWNNLLNSVLARLSLARS